MSRIIKLLAPLLVLVLVLLTVNHIRHARGAVPTGFQNTLLIGTGLGFPTAIEFAPDGRLFILEQGGQIKIYKNGALLPRFFDELPAYANADRGLLGIAFDPEFNTNHFLYFYYIDSSDLTHRVVRFNASGDIATNGPVEIYNSHQAAGTNHAGGTIQFGPDGKLYIGIGDSNQAFLVQSLGSPFGKVLRINKNGSVPSDNPYVGQAGKLPEVWAYGFRNPFRFQFDSATGDLYLGDVGESTWEEINLVTKGGNYGWPNAEGVCNGCGYINPIYAYLHTTPGFSVTDGPVYHGNMFPDSYKGKLFFGDFGNGFIKTLDLATHTASDFNTSAGSVVDLKVGPDGALYYVTIYPGRVYRTTYSEGNQLPIAEGSANTFAGTEPLTVNFSSTGSSDPEGDPLTYAWDFGDGTTSSVPHPVKTYANKGTYVVQLTVNDGQASSLAAPLEIKVGTPPTVAIELPINGSIYRAGDTISYKATALDGEGGSLPDSSLSVEVVFHHNVHFHPFLRPTVGGMGTFTVPTIGESATDVGFEVRATATDSFGLSTTASISIVPKTSELTLQTEPLGLKVTLGGVDILTPHDIHGVVGFQHQVDAPIQQKDGKFYEFDHWSDGGAQKHFLTIPETPGTLIAHFREQNPYKGEYFSNKFLQGSPVLVRNDQTINFDWHQFSPDPSMSADNFSVRWTKKQFFSFGRYKFTTSTDDGARLYIDGQLVIDKWINHGETAYSHIIDLEEGEHDIKMEYYEDGGGAVARLIIELTPDQPTPPAPFTGYKGEYFVGAELTGTPVVVRDDPTIDFNWQHWSPGAGLPANGFSVRWTGKIITTADWYRFAMYTDDGIRIYIDGELILNQWNDHGPTIFTADKQLTAGLHNIKVEYYENTGGAEAHVSFNKTALPSVPFAVKYFNNQQLQGSAVLTAQAPQINYILELTSPDPAVNADHFSAKFTKTQEYTAGNHTFTVQADDGVRLYIDNALVIDAWYDQPAATYSTTQTLTAGDHDIRLEYYENAGQSTIIYYEE